MKLGPFLKTSILAGAMAALPGLFAAPRTTPYREASLLLNNLQTDAHKVSLEADSIQSLLKGTDVEWEPHAVELDRVRNQVNDMGAKLSRLESLRGSVAPWEQKAIDQIAPQVRLMADNAEDAIHFLNNHRNERWMPRYARYIDNLSAESQRISHMVRNFQEYAKVHQEDRNLGKTLGLTAGE